MSFIGRGVLEGPIRTLKSLKRGGNVATGSTTSHGHREGGLRGFSKKSKTPFFRDIEKSFQEVTPIGPEPHHFFSFSNYLNKYGC